MMASSFRSRVSLPIACAAFMLLVTGEQAPAHECSVRYTLIQGAFSEGCIGRVFGGGPFCVGCLTCPGIRTGTVEGTFEMKPTRVSAGKNTYAILSLHWMVTLLDGRQFMVDCEDGLFSTKGYDSRDPVEMQLKVDFTDLDGYLPFDWKSASFISGNVAEPGPATPFLPLPTIRLTLAARGNQCCDVSFSIFAVPESWWNPWQICGQPAAEELCVGIAEYPPVTGTLNRHCDPVIPHQQIGKKFTNPIVRYHVTAPSSATNDVPVAVSVEYPAGQANPHPTFTTNLYNIDGAPITSIRPGETVILDVELDDNGAGPGDYLASIHVINPETGADKVLLHNVIVDH